MKNLKKKGFTIVELVIVIAVIAVLAAVLIPTFSNLIKKANQSADIQAVRQMNTALAVEVELNDINDVIDALAKAGYNSKESLIPISTGYTFYWHEDTKQIILVNENNEVVFPTGVVYNNNCISLENSVQYIDAVVNDAETFEKAILNGNKEIILSENIIFNSVVYVPAESNIIVNLNGKTISTEFSDSPQTKHAYAFDVKGQLTLKNGTINARGIMLTNENASLVVEEGITINALDSDGGYCIYTTAGGNITINGGTFNVKSGSYAIAYKGTSRSCIIQNAIVSGVRGAISIIAGSATIKNTTATVDLVENENYTAYHAIACGNATIIIESGNYSTEGESEVFSFTSECTESGSITIKAGVVVDNVVTQADETKTETK